VLLVDDDAAPKYDDQRLLPQRQGNPEVRVVRQAAGAQAVRHARCAPPGTIAAIF
jgi:hypothetical protein